ncbi:hypothetical protein Pmani_002357 [Petrolisthes manimaculis]|uniref:Uncharacterized protein n=1 Tax=Petrolisthes manimaculis TaxID=1843537 RepID=A0AAE1QIN4_9EUCA|nr:hypothetical protein Pmani_002357 [Petrolisthes manimaculis]
MCKKRSGESTYKMKTNKTPDPNEILVEVLRAVGEVEGDLLWNLMCKIKEEKEITDEWRKSVLIPVF